MYYKGQLLRLTGILKWRYWSIWRVFPFVYSQNKTIASQTWFICCLCFVSKCLCGPDFHCHLLSRYIPHFEKKKKALFGIRSVIQSCPALCDPMDCSTSVFSVLHYLPDFAQIHVYWISDAIQPYHPSPLVPFSSCLQSFPASGSFPMSQLHASGGQSTGASASTSVPFLMFYWVLFFSKLSHRNNVIISVRSAG